jgi:anti-sigma B factor antagonist
MNNLEISERRLAGVTVLDLRGSIRLGQGNIDLHQALKRLVEKGDRYVVINLADVTHVDSSGLGELVAGYTTLQRSHGELKLLKLTERVHELMVITKLLTVFEVFDDEAEAIASFNVSDNTSDEVEAVTGSLDPPAAALGGSQ